MTSWLRRRGGVYLMWMAASIVGRAESVQALPPTLGELTAAAEAGEALVSAGHLTYLCSSRRASPAALPQQLLHEFPGLDRVALANQETRTRETLWFDSRVPVFKQKRVDLRDTDALITEHAVPPSRRASVRQTGTFLAGATHDYTVEWSPDARRLTMMPVPAAVSRRPPLHTGIIPSRSLRNRQNVSISMSTWEGREAIAVSIAGAAETTWTYIADPELDYRFRQLSVTDSQGSRIRQILASDYRSVGGALLPFRWEDRSFDSGTGESIREESIVVEAASFDPPSAGDFALRVPAGTQVTNVVGPVRQIFTLADEETVDLDGARRLARRDEP